MTHKKTYILFGAFILFWIIFIGWGMIKTSLKLSKEKAAPTEIPKATTQPKEAPTESKASQPVTAPESEISLTQVRVIQAKKTNFNDILPVMGTVKGEKEIGIRFEINGVIKAINFREGQKVNAGDIVACLDTKDTELKLAYATNKFNSTQAAYNSTQKKLEVHRKLYEAGAIIKSKLEEVELECDSAKFQAETTKSEMELAKNELTKTCIRATRNGVIGPREAEEGEFVSPQDKVISIFEINNVFVDVGVVERDIEKIKLNQKTRVYVDAYPNRDFEGAVENIFPVVEGKSRTLTVRIKVANPEELLLPGMFSRAEILVAELQDVILVPTTCLISVGKGITLLPIIPAQSIEKSEAEAEIGTVQLRRVNLGYITSDYVQIGGGLDAWDFVVLETQGELKDNTQVKIVGKEELAL